MNISNYNTHFPVTGSLSQDFAASLQPSAFYGLARNLNGSTEISPKPLGYVFAEQAINLSAKTFSALKQGAVAFDGLLTRDFTIFPGADAVGTSETSSPNRKINNAEEIIQFVEKLDPKNPTEAKKILSWGTEFDEKKFTDNPTKYLKGLSRKLALIAHPDKCASELQAGCEKTFNKINESIKTLIDYNNSKIFWTNILDLVGEVFAAIFK